MRKRQAKTKYKQLSIHLSENFMSFGAVYKNNLKCYFFLLKTDTLFAMCKQSWE